MGSGPASRAPPCPRRAAGARDRSRNRRSPGRGGRSIGRASARDRGREWDRNPRAAQQRRGAASSGRSESQNLTGPRVQQQRAHGVIDKGGIGGVDGEEEAINGGAIEAV